MKAVPNQACVINNDILGYETSDGVKWSEVEINTPYVFHREVEFSEACQQ